MGNCLVTKLKASVDNDNLPKLGVLTLNVEATAGANSDAAKVGFNCLSPITVKPVGGHIWLKRSDYGDETKWTDQEITINPRSGYVPGNASTSVTYVYCENKNFKLEVSSKYDISIVFTNTGGFLNKSNVQINTADLKFLPLVCCYLGYANNTFGDVKDIPMDNLQELNLVWQNNIVGNLSDITSINLEYLGLYNSGVRGSIEDFVSAQCDAGRTSVLSNEPISVRAILEDGRTFGGRIYNLGNVFAFMYWEGKNKIAIYQNGKYSDNSYTHVYVKGFSASDSEVVAWKAAGKTVVDATTGEEL